MLSPTDADMDDEYLGPPLIKALAGSNISARDRTKIFKVIRDRYLSEAGTRNQVFERLNGTPLVVMRFLTLQRMEYSVDGPMAELARNVCGLGNAEERAARAKEERENT
jgi:aromatic ring hydroxylase